MNIEATIGLPIKIDPATLSMYQGLYARVLVNVDVSRRLPERILASLKNKRSHVNVIF